MHARRFGTAVLVFALATASAGGAYAQGQEPTAQDQAAAEGLFEDAKKSMAEGHFAEACPKLEESDRLDPAPGTKFRLAECYEQVGRTASAWALFLNVAAAARSASMTDREQIARDRAAALEPKLSKLVIVVDAPVPDLEVKRDGVLVGRAQWGTALAIDPGKHPITASAPGKQPWTATVDVGAGIATVKVPPLSDAAAAAAAPGETAPSARRSGLGTQRTLALVAAGVGVVGVGVGSVFGLRGMSKLSDSDDHCSGNFCDRVGVTARKDAVSAGDLSTIFFGVGIAALAGAAVLWFTAPKTTQEDRAALRRPNGVAGAIADTLLGGTF